MKTKSVCTRVSARRQGGFTLIELMITVAIIGILAAIAISLYTGLQSRARIAKAQADVRTLGSAVTAYAAHTGGIPTSPANMSAGLTTATTVSGIPAGPFLGNIPMAPSGGTPNWGAYSYTADVAPGGAPAPASFVVCSSGDGTFANSAGISSCP